MHTVVFSTPRTGSVLLSWVLARYLSQKFGTVSYPREFLNEYLYNVSYLKAENGQLLNLPDPVAGAVYIKPVLQDGKIVNLTEERTGRIDIESETLRRLDMLRQLKKPHLFREHAAPLSEDGFQLLKRMSRFICIERHNKLEQMLSFAVAHHTKIWMTTSLDSYPAPTNVVLSKALFDQLAQRIAVYKRRVAELTDRVLVSYEDMLKLDTPFIILETLGYADWRDYIDPATEQLPAKVSSVVNVTAYANLAEIQQWCSEIAP